MEDMIRDCPLCGLPMEPADGYFTCTEHGDWHSYSALLLVRAPSADDKAFERVRMPWEPLLKSNPSGAS